MWHSVCHGHSLGRARSVGLGEASVCSHTATDPGEPPCQGAWGLGRDRQNGPLHPTPHLSSVSHPCLHQGSSWAINQWLIPLPPAQSDPSPQPRCHCEGGPAPPLSSGAQQGWWDCGSLLVYLREDHRSHAWARTGDMGTAVGWSSGWEQGQMLG